MGCALNPNPTQRNPKSILLAGTRGADKIKKVDLAKYTQPEYLNPNPNSTQIFWYGSEVIWVNPNYPNLFRVGMCWYVLPATHK